MDKKNKILYGPKERDYFEEEPKEVKSYSLKDSTELPDHITDPVVANNIATSEFDYTYDNLDEE